LFSAFGGSTGSNPAYAVSLRILCRDEIGRVATATVLGFAAGYPFSRCGKRARVTSAILGGLMNKLPVRALTIADDR
jgi:hypothetical protein